MIRLLLAAHDGRMERVTRRYAMLEPTTIMPRPRPQPYPSIPDRGHGPHGALPLREAWLRRADRTGEQHDEPPFDDYGISGLVGSGVLTSIACANIRNAPNRRPTHEILGAS